MASKFMIFIILSIIFLSSPAISKDDVVSSKIKSLSNSQDIDLPDWGPYTKKYIGVSHIPEMKKGIRFDLSVFPGLYRRKISVPNVFFESDYYPWEASPHYEYFSFRHEIEWKDQLYTDISYSQIDDQSRLIRIECVNNTDINQNISLHFMASIHFPSIKEYRPHTPIYPAVIELPKGSKWIDGLDYSQMRFAKSRASDDLVYDGKFRGEIRDNGFSNGSGLGQNFGIDKGDQVNYEITIGKSIPDAIIYLRYRMLPNDEISFELSGLTNRDVMLKGSGDFSVLEIPLGNVKKGQHNLSLISRGGNAVELDGLAIISSENADEVKITMTEWHPEPEIISGPTDKSLILKYEDIDIYYGIMWDFDLFRIRQWLGRDLSDYFRRMTNNHTRHVLTGEGKGHFTNVYLRPIELTPTSVKTMYGIVCCGSKEEVETKLASLNSKRSAYEDIYLKARGHVVKLKTGGLGDKYAFSQERMSATSLGNVVYPVYTQRQYIRHSAPGRYWDCLYTWDSGFIGLGILELDTERAIDNLNAYVMAPEAQSAFLHHGTPLPVQQYLFQSLWNKTQSKELLEYFYPRMKKFHRFLTGRAGSSTTRNLKSNLIRTWDYFYNSGGWDDYPPQEHVHDNDLTQIVTPVVSTAHSIRTAKILKMAASHLGIKKDMDEFDRDIDVLSRALQEHSWDDESGYFGYVVHNDAGYPEKILTYEDNVNFNMGLDGMYPLFAGICTEEQKSIILERLKSAKHIWSDVGLSAVDQSAPYYKIDGYWNGTVWMPHQWFYWKTMLDLGESDFAFKIATTALNLWKKEVEASYRCMEHFLIKTGRGAGWHEFGGLSTPVLSWYAAYFRPGNFTTGLNIWIHQLTFGDDNSRMTADITVHSDNSRICSVVACMNPNNQYHVTWNGKEIDYKILTEGTLSIDLPVGTENARGSLRINK